MATETRTDPGYAVASHRVRDMLAAARTLADVAEHDDWDATLDRVAQLNRFGPEARSAIERALREVNGEVHVTSADRMAASLLDAFDLLNLAIAKSGGRELTGYKAGACDDA